jgi:hypothetical protein
MWGLIGGLVAWQKITPPAVVQAAPAVVAPVATPLPPPPPVEILTPAASPPNPFTDPTVRVTKSERIEIDPEVAQAIGVGVKKLFWEILAGKPEPADDGPAKRAIPAGCRTFDTAVHFTKNYDTARQRAATDGKLVFVLHLSGDLDDDGFT